MDDQLEQRSTLDAERQDDRPVAARVCGPAQDRPAADAGVIPPPEARPESQGDDVLDAGRQAEDASSRRLLSDEQAETSD